MRALTESRTKRATNQHFKSDGLALPRLLMLSERAFGNGRAFAKHRSTSRCAMSAVASRTPRTRRRATASERPTGSARASRGRRSCLDEVRALHLQPVAAPAPVQAVVAFRHDALESEFTGLGEHDRAARCSSSLSVRHAARIAPVRLPVLAGQLSIWDGRRGEALLLGAGAVLPFPGRKGCTKQRWCR